ncbi:MAG: homocysteine S-methyltransferase family protein, partial [Planctomycetota bacterium]
MTPLERLAAGEVVLLDGATGTELQRRGVPMHDKAWSAGALLSHPEEVQGVHEEHLRAGADVILTNTFGTNHDLLRRADLEDRFEEINRAAVDLALRARDAAAGDREVAVGGSLNIWHHPGDLDRTRQEVAEQSALLADAGVDFIALELMESVAEIRLAVEAARPTGLDVWVGLSVRPSDSGELVLLRDEEPLAEAMEPLAALDAAAFLVMHSLPRHVGPALKIMREHWKGPLGAYAHMGAFTM